jgi:hypothetical protein
LLLAKPGNGTTAQIKDISRHRLARRLVPCVI